MWLKTSEIQNRNYCMCKLFLKCEQVVGKFFLRRPALYTLAPRFAKKKGKSAMITKSYTQQVTKSLTQKLQRVSLKNCKESHSKIAKSFTPNHRKEFHIKNIANSFTLKISKNVPLNKSLRVLKKLLRVLLKNITKSCTIKISQNVPLNKSLRVSKKIAKSFTQKHCTELHIKNIAKIFTLH
jgi:hypothetical protein